MCFIFSGAPIWYNVPVMDLSNVEIEVDPESELRLVKKGDLKKLTVRGGLRPGTVITVR